MEEKDQNKTIVSNFIKNSVCGDLQSLIKSIIHSSESVLEIGCGIGDYLKLTNSEMNVTAVEPHLPYLNVAKERVPWVSFFNTDGISFLKSTEKKFDCILLIDVVEHLIDEESKELIKLAKEHSKKIVFSQIPIGIHEQHGDDWNLGGEFWQTHRSTWTEKNIKNLGFSYIEIWKDWYQWDENINKSQDTSIALWLTNFDETGITPILDDYTRKLKNDNFSAWQKAYTDGYNSSMGNHINYFYNTYISEIGFYNELELAQKIVEYAPGDASFMQVFIEMFPEKEFNLIDISETNLTQIKKNLEKYSNVNYYLNYPEVKELENIDVVFSFLLSQSMPKTLWISHLETVFNMLNVGGAYFFQFAYHPDGFANDSIDVAISGGNKYTQEEITSQLENIGFKGCDFTVPILLEKFNTDTVWYLCRAYK